MKLKEVRRNRFVVYSEDGKVLLQSSNKNVCLAYMEALKNGAYDH